MVINNGLMVGLLSVLVHRIGRRIEYVFYLIKENKFVLIFLFGFSECGHSGDSHNFFFFFYHFFILKHCFVIIFFNLSAAVVVGDSGYGFEDQVRLTYSVLTMDSL